MSKRKSAQAMLAQENGTEKKHRDDKNVRVGFIGLGVMGYHMAAHLTKVRVCMLCHMCLWVTILRQLYVLFAVGQC